MCPSKPKVVEPAPVPDPAPPVEQTASTITRDTGDKASSRSSAKKAKTRKSASDLRVDLNIPGAAGVGLQV